MRKWNAFIVAACMVAACDASPSDEELAKACHPTFIAYRPGVDIVVIQDGYFFRAEYWKSGRKELSFLQEDPAEPGWYSSITSLSREEASIEQQGRLLFESINYDLANRIALEICAERGGVYMNQAVTLEELQSRIEAIHLRTAHRRLRRYLDSEK